MDGRSPEGKLQIICYVQENTMLDARYGRFRTLMDVVSSYNDRFNLGLTEQEKKDLVEYLKSL